MFRLFRRQPFIRLKLEQPVQIVALSADNITAVQPVLLRSAAQAEQNCAAIAYARRKREEGEAQLKELIETERLERWA